MSPFGVGRSKHGTISRASCPMGHFGTSKTHECDVVDMTKQLRAVLMAHKENALLRAFQLGETSVADKLVFPSEAGTPICPDNIGPRYMEPALEKAGFGSSGSMTCGICSALS